MFVLFRKFFLLLISLAQASSTKWLVDHPGFDNPQMWLSEYLPCALEEVVFPEMYAAILPFPNEVDVSGFILPKEGGILLNQDATINLGGELKSRDCENGRSRKAYIKPPNTSKWFDPHSWRTSRALSRNSALPEMERVPCNNESVVIQRNGPLSIDLENVPYMRMGELSLAGSLISKDYLKSLINTDIGQILFKNTVGVSVEYYRNDICGCHKDFSQFIEPICHNVVESCQRPHCLMPVTPFTSCCAICGSILKFAVESCDDANLHKLRKVIESAISDQELTDDLDYHVSYINSQEYGNYLQAIIVDRETYSEKSVNLMVRLNASTDWTKLFAAPQRLEVQFSGRPYNPNITFGSILLIILCFVFVTIVGLVIFAHYAPDNRHLSRIPQWIHDPRRWRAFIYRSPFLFARFDNSAVGGAREDDMQEQFIMGYDSASGEVQERAFDNPMFGGNLKASSEPVAGIGSKEQQQKVKPMDDDQKLENATLPEAVEGHEEQELTEIRLESSSEEDSDEEEETKE